MLEFVKRTSAFCYISSQTREEEGQGVPAYENLQKVLSSGMKIICTQKAIIPQRKTLTFAMPSSTF